MSKRIERGMKDSVRQQVKAMLHHGRSVDDVAKVTGLTVEQVKQLDKGWSDVVGHTTGGRRHQRVGKSAIMEDGQKQKRETGNGFTQVAKTDARTKPSARTLGRRRSRLEG